jgi:hypothetical protein
MDLDLPADIAELNRRVGPWLAATSSNRRTHPGGSARTEYPSERAQPPLRAMRTQPRATKQTRL